MGTTSVKAIYYAGSAGKIKPAGIQPPEGMVGWWPGDGNASDIQGGNHGTFQGGATATSAGIVGQAFSFQGTGDFVEVPDSNSIDITDAITIDTWVYPTSFPGNRQAVVHKWVQPKAYVLKITDRIPRITITTSSGFFTCVSTETISTNAWYHLAATYDSSSGKLEFFVNGTLKNTCTWSGKIQINSGPITFGYRSDALGGDQFLGLIDELEIFNRALTAGEIKAIYDAGSAGKRKPQPIQPPGGMVGWWPGDENANDIQGGNHGTLSGDATFAGGMVGQAFSFDGTGDFVEVPHNASLKLPQFSVDAWVLIDPALTAGQYNVIVGKEDGSTANGGVGLIYDDRNSAGKLIMSVISGPSVFSNAILPNAITNASFYHLAGTFDGSQARLYLNGSLVVTGPAIPGIAFNTFPLRIGAMNLKERTGIDDRFEGLIDEVELFDRALSAAEIRAIYDAGSAGKIKPAGHQPPEGMVSWWPGDGNASDIQGGNHGTLSGDATASADGIVGQAFSFDASLNSGVIVPHGANLNMTEAITLDAWVRPLSFPNAFPTVMRKHTDAASNIQYILAVTDQGKAHCNIGNFGVPTGGTVVLNGWTHLACVYDRVAVRIYVNGEEVAAAPATQQIPAGSMPLGIGRAESYTIRNFEGLIDEVELFDRVLTAAEIKAIYDAGSAGKRKP